MQDYYVICRIRVLADNESHAQGKLSDIFISLLKDSKIIGYQVGKTEALEDILDKQMAID